MKTILKKKTKIVATIGPATESQKQLENLIKAGLNVVRLNFSHNTHEWHLAVLKRAQKAAKKQSQYLAILQDLSGPKIRIGKLKEESINLVKRKKIILTTKKVLGTTELLSVNYKNLPKDVKKGDILKLEDGKKELRVDKKNKTDIFCTVIVGGKIGSYKGINVPGVSLSVSSLTPKDKKDVLFGIENNVDFIALSFVQTKNDILHLRKILDAHKCRAQVIAKIETSAAIENIDEIIGVSDGIMVARGDMAIEIGAEHVPMVQKMIIEKCNTIGKPVITATQMLDSMENSPIPTRAEVSDIANAILDGTDAIMLSGETTIGKFPLKAVETMTSIAQRTEPFLKNTDLEYVEGNISLVDTMTQSTVQIANNIGARLIITLTESGFTSRMVARFKPEHQIIAITPHIKVARILNLSYGCKPIIMDIEHRTQKVIEKIQKLVKDKKWAKKGENIVITMGYPFGISGSTNKIFVIEAK